MHASEINEIVAETYTRKRLIAILLIPQLTPFSQLAAWGELYLNSLILLVIV